MGKKHDTGGHEHQRRIDAVAVRWFEQLGALATGRFEAIVAGTRHDATAFAESLGSMLADANAAVRAGLDEVAAYNRSVRDRCAELRADAEHDRGLLREVHAAAHSAARELEHGAREHFAELEARGHTSLAQLDAFVAGVRDRATARADAEVDRVAARANERLHATRREIDDEVQALRAELSIRLTAVLADVDREVGELRALARTRVEHAVAATEATTEVNAEPTTEVTTEPTAEPTTEVTAPVAPLGAHDTPEARDGDDEAGLGDDDDDRVWDDLATSLTETAVDPGDDANFFSRLAAELRSDPDQDRFPTGDADAATTTS